MNLKPTPNRFLLITTSPRIFLPLALLGKALLGLQGIFLATLLSNLLLGAIAWRWLGAQIARAASMAD